jgi:RHS repeat-associated protein
VSAGDGRLTTFGYDGNGNQVTKAVRTGWVTQETTYGYDEDNRLRTLTVPATPPGEPTFQWASSATASDAWAQTGSWAPSHATGAPNTNGCIASGQAWAGTNAGAHWLRLEYATPARTLGVRVHETGGTGGVTKVELIDEADAVHEVWTGTDGTFCGEWLEVKLAETPYRVKAVKLSTVGTKNIDAVALRRQRLGEAVADALGSIYALTNSSGALVGKQGYEVFGAPTPPPSGPAGQPFGFTGREHELDSGLVYARARYFAPVVGAFVTSDPLRAAAAPELRGDLASTERHVLGDLPPYSYANAAPTS